MPTLITPINTTTHLLRTIMVQLQSLDALSLPSPSREHIRRLALCRLARSIETALPHHYGHGERTARYASALGIAAELPSTQQHELHDAALLHDIGLLTLPQHLTAPNASLSSDDYVLVQSHSRAGAQILSTFQFLGRAALLVAHHHEHWDGSGYPYGLRGDYVPLPARILAIADSFDAMMRESRSISRSLRILQASSRTQFDPDLVSLFSTLSIHEKPPTAPGFMTDQLYDVDASGVGRALPLRAGEGASVPPEAPSPSLLGTNHVFLNRKGDRP